MTARTDRGSATATTVGRPFPQAIEVAGLERSFGGVVVLAVLRFAGKPRGATAALR